MTMPAEQQELFEVLSAKLAAQHSEEALLRQVDDMLGSLLRREGDRIFLQATRVAFTDGVADKPLDEQRMLAHVLLGIVLDKRPEIAEAWRARHRPAEPPPQLRREVDHAPPPTVPAAVADEPPPPPAAPSYPHASAESLVGHHIADTLVGKLKPLHLEMPPAPTQTFCEEQPFFLLRPAFSDALEEFARGPLTVMSRPSLERHVYRACSRADLKDPGSRRAFLDDKRPAIWKIVGERLGKMATQHVSARAKLALAAERDGPAPPQFKVVKVPVTVPKVHRVMGVSFQFGEEVIYRPTRVRVRSATDLDGAEQEALATMDVFRALCGQRGIVLPEAADLQFLRSLVELDGKVYGRTVAEFAKLASHAETSRAYMAERLALIDKNFNNYFADTLEIFLFNSVSSDAFNFKNLYDRCVGAGSNRSAVASRRPFLQAEVSRRPRELVAQLRTIIAAGGEPETLATGARILLSIWRVISAVRFGPELAEARTALERLASGLDDPRQARLAAETAQILLHGLDQPKPDDDHTARLVAHAARGLG